jgi:hypothetical protein
MSIVFSLFCYANTQRITTTHMKKSKSVCMTAPMHCLSVSTFSFYLVLGPRVIGACFGLVVVVLGPNQLRAKTVCCCICVEIICLSMNKTYLLSSPDRNLRLSENTAVVLSFRLSFFSK